MLRKDNERQIKTSQGKIAQLFHKFGDIIITSSILGPGSVYLYSVETGQAETQQC